MLFKLFKIFLKIGAFTLGGGYAMLPLIEEEIVQKEGMITSEEYYDIIAISSSLPGAMAINCSVFVGYKLRKTAGAVVSLLGTILPAFFAIVLVSSFFYKISDLEQVKWIFKGIRPTVVVLIAVSLIKIIKNTDFSGAKKIIVAIAFVLLILNISSFFVIIGAGVVGFLVKGGHKNAD